MVQTDAERSIDERGSVPGERIVVHEDFAFAVHDDVELLGDLYLPPGKGPFPALVLLYGGGWRLGNRKRTGHWGRLLARHGCAGFSATYRLSTPETPTFLETIRDVRSAVQFVRGRGPEFGIDPARVGAMGSSAGGHLTAMLGLAAEYPEFVGGYPDDPYPDLPAKVDVAIPICGVFDLIAQWEHDQLHRPEDQITEQYIGGTPMSHRETFYKGSPQYHAGKQNAAGTRWLIAWGTEDDIVDPEQSRSFVPHLKRAGGTVRIAPIAGASHFWIQESPLGETAVSADFAERLLEFLDGTCAWGTSRVPRALG